MVKVKARLAEIPKYFFSKIKIKEALTYNILMKLVSLFIALLIWFYISGEITKSIKV